MVFLGFTYSSCSNQNTMNKDFALMKTLGARHVRMYGDCDGVNYLEMFLNAAGPQDLGVLATIWFGYDGTDQWKTRETSIINTTLNHPYGYLVVAISVGNEELFDNTISASALIGEFQHIHNRLGSVKIPVSTSELTFKYENDVANAADIILDNCHPYFATDASTGDAAWPDVSSDMKHFKSVVPNKKIVITETGWPSVVSSWKPNSPRCVTDLKNEQAYWTLMADHCPDFKAWNIGYFAFCFNEDCMTGWGVVNDNDKPKFTWVEKTAC